MSDWVPAPRSQVRIGDVERDQAVSALGEHFVAGRLTQEEFDERSDTATRARYAGDLAPLFADLPGPAASAPRGAQNWSPAFRPGPPPPFVWLAPVLMIGLIVTAVVLTAPWVLWLLFGIFLFRGRGPGGRHWQGHRGGYHYQRMTRSQ
jgi:hypothetical protein